MEINCKSCLVYFLTHFVVATDPDDFQPSNKVKACKYLDEKGKERDYDPNFLPSKSNVFGENQVYQNQENGWGRQHDHTVFFLFEKST